VLYNSTRIVQPIEPSMSATKVANAPDKRNPRVPTSPLDKPPLKETSGASELAEAANGRESPGVKEHPDADSTFEADESGSEEDIESSHSRAPSPPLIHADMDEEEQALRETLRELREQNLQELFPHLATWTLTEPEDDWEVCRTTIEHQFETTNRSVEGALQTDVFLIDGTGRSLAQSDGKKHTRIFEAVGHYLPNLLTVREGKPVALAPKWRTVTGSPSACRLVDARAPPRKGWVRYRLVNGKHAELRAAKGGPLFAMLPGCADLHGFPCAGIRADITAQEIGGLPEAPLLNASELFDEAVRRAGSVEEVKILPYMVPTQRALPDSKYLPEWLELRLAKEPKVLGPPVASAKLAVEIALAELDAILTTDAGREALELIRETVTNDMDDETADRIYSEMIVSLAPPVEPHHLPHHTGLWVENVGDFDVDETTSALVEYSINGATELVNVEELPNDYVRPYPAVLAPSHCSPSALTVLSWQASLGERLTVKHGKFTVSVPWYALSVTPSKETESRGTGSDGYTWFERMLAQVDFVGPVFHASSEDDTSAQQWANVFNTTWLEEAMVAGELEEYPQLYLMPASPFPLDAHVDIPNHARGVGVVDGRLTLSPLMQVREEWESDCRQDSRLHFPRAVLRVLLEHPDVLRVEALDDYLSARVPLRLTATVENEEHTSFYYPGMTFNVKATTPQQVFVLADAASVVTSETGGVKLPPAPVVPAKSKKIAETSDSEWGIPSDTTAPGWQLKSVGVKRPHAEVPAFSNKVSITKIGNWDAVSTQLEMVGLTPELIKQFYSVHWQAANTNRKHPVVQYHHPLWTSSLKGVPVNRRRWFWPTGPIAPCPWLSTDDAGGLPLFGGEAKTFLAKQKQRELNAQRYAASFGKGGGRGVQHIPTRPVTRPTRGGRGGGLAPRRPPTPPSSSRWDTSDSVDWSKDATTTADTSAWW